MSKKSIKFTSSNIINLRDEICKTKTKYWKIIKSENIMSNKEKKAGVGSGFDLKVLHNQILQMSEKLIKTKLMLNAINNGITKFDYDFDLVSGRYVIDAKSIMGIFSLDLSKPIDLNIHAEDNIDDVLKVLEPYMV